MTNKSYEAAMAEWHAYQARAKKAASAYRRHVNRNARKSGPLVKLSRKYAEEADRRFILEDHPADCPVCSAANATHPDAVVAAHRAVIEKLAADRVAREAEIAEARERHYAGGYRLMREGVPYRMAAVVATFKNKGQLLRSTEPEWKIDAYNRALDERDRKAAPAPMETYPQYTAQEARAA